MIQHGSRSPLVEQTEEVKTAINAAVEVMRELFNTQADILERIQKQLAIITGVTYEPGEGDVG